MTNDKLTTIYQAIWKSALGTADDIVLIASGINGEAKRR